MRRHARYAPLSAEFGVFFMQGNAMSASRRFESGLHTGQPSSCHHDVSGRRSRRRGSAFGKCGRIHSADNRAILQRRPAVPCLAVEAADTAPHVGKAPFLHFEEVIMIRKQGPDDRHQISRSGLKNVFRQLRGMSLASKDDRRVRETALVAPGEIKQRNRGNHP